MSALTLAALLGAGAVGAVLRYLTGRLGSPSRFPWPVLLVNVIGSAVAGVLIGMNASNGIDPGLELVLLTGFCGGLTTFSTWSVETVQLAVEGRWAPAALSVGANLVLGLGACFVGYALAML